MTACPRCHAPTFTNDDGRYCWSCGWSGATRAAVPVTREASDLMANAGLRHDGCSVSPSCFTCRLAECTWQYDTKAPAVDVMRRSLRRYGEIAASFERGLSTEAIMAEHHVSERTVHRALGTVRRLAA
jgi:hypothetical protein